MRDLSVPDRADRDQRTRRSPDVRLCARGAPVPAFGESVPGNIGVCVSRGAASIHRQTAAVDELMFRTHHG